MKTVSKPIVKSIVIIFLCFLITSTGWLSWEYNLLEIMPAETSDMMTMVIGYLFQAAGIGLFAVMFRYKRQTAQRMLPAALALHIGLMIPSVLGGSAALVLVSGFFMNIICGIIAGYYLYYLTVNVEIKNKAKAFGTGYGASILASWLISKIAGGALYYSDMILIICGVLTAAAIIFQKAAAGDDPDNELISDAAALNKPDKKRYIVFACILVLLMSVVNGSGFAFPSADLGGIINVELSRLFYAAGLIAAGFITDRSRRYGSVCAVAALVLPFVVMALRSETVPALVLWALGYFVFGFFAVYRIILFSDFASKEKLVFLSGFGLMIGRIGDAVGEGVCMVLSENTALLVAVTALLFIFTVFVFFRIYQQTHFSQKPKFRSEQERFNMYAAQHELSAREQEVLGLLIEKKTNTEIAEALSVSERTVKFHIHNILQKTGCRNRNELLSSYLTCFMG